MRKHKGIGRRNGAFLPHLEALENRCTPAVSFSQNGGELFITGDSAANVVTVTAQGNDRFQVVVTGGQTRTFNGLETIRASLRGGNDSITFNLQEDADLYAAVSTGVGNDLVRFNIDTVEEDDELELSVNTGAGNDRFLLGAAPGSTTTPVFEEDASLDINLDTSDGTQNATGGNGATDDDIVSIRPGSFREEAEAEIDVQLGGGTNTFTSYVRGTLADDSEYDLEVDSGTGQDTITLVIGTVLDADVFQDVQSGGGVDTIIAEFSAIGEDAEFELMLDAGSASDEVDLRFRNILEADVSSFVNLGAGDDDFFFTANGGVDEDAEFELELDGGPGDDLANSDLSASARSAVEAEVRNIERRTSGPRPA